MKVQVLCDNKNSWIMPYAIDIVTELISMNHDASLINDSKNVTEGDILILLSCENVFRNLKLNKHNLVVHESALPQGKGWSPLTWQILEGKNIIPITLFEASEKVDAGNIYETMLMEFDGLELIDELRKKQGFATKKLVINFINNYPNNIGKAQNGQESFYKKRLPSDAKLDINKSVAEQFNLLRVSDNQRYPAYFEINNQKYIITIQKEI